MGGVREVRCDRGRLRTRSWGGAQSLLLCLSCDLRPIDLSGGAVPVAGGVLPVRHREREDPVARRDRRCERNRGSRTAVQKDEKGDCERTRDVGRCAGSRGSRRAVRAGEATTRILHEWPGIRPAFTLDVVGEPPEAAIDATRTASSRFAAGNLCGAQVLRVLGPDRPDQPHVPGAGLSATPVPDSVAGCMEIPASVDVSGAR